MCKAIYTASNSITSWSHFYMALFAHTRGGERSRAKKRRKNEAEDPAWLASILHLFFNAITHESTCYALERKKNVTEKVMNCVEICTLLLRDPLSHKIGGISGTMSPLAERVCLFVVLPKKKC